MTAPIEQSYLLTVAHVRRETADAVSVTFDVPEELAEVFAFSPGQFLTLGVPSDLTGLVARCYSINVPPGEPLNVTVKRTVDGYASNWINDNEFVVEGSMTLNDLAEMAEELELDSGEVTTVGGYITQQLGRFPEVGEIIEINGWEAKVTSTDGRRVGQIHFRRLEPALAEGGEDEEE